MTLAQGESWAWRMLMPALLFGGVAASWVIVVVALLRVTSWWRNHRSEPWSWNWGSAGWLLFFGLQVAGGMWSENVEAWRFSLEVKSSMWALPVLAAMPGRSMAGISGGLSAGPSRPTSCGASLGPAGTMSCWAMPVSGAMPVLRGMSTRLI